MDSRKLPLYHVVNIKQNESYIIVYANTDNGISKVWKRFNPKSELQEEEYLEYEKEPLYIINTNEESEPPEKNKTSYQQFLKTKREEYEKLYPHMTKKERYNLVLEEWKKNKN